MYQKNFVKLLIFYFSFLWMASFSSAILPTHYLAQGLTFTNIAFGNFLVYIGVIAGLLYTKKFSSRLAWRLAPIIWFVFILLIIRIVSPIQYYLAVFTNGLALIFFYIFYNIAHFRGTPRERRGESSALMFILGPIASVFAPLFAGTLAQINISLLWLGTTVFVLINLLLAGFQNNFALHYSLGAALKEIGATRSFIFLEGVWEALPFSIIPIYTLFFIQTPLKYGAFAAYLAAFGVISNLILGRLTDRLQKRVVFLYPLTIGLALVTLLFPAATANLQLWALLAVAISFLMPLFWNLSTAMVVDSHSNLDLAIPGREFALALGRITGLFLAFLSFTIEKTPKYIFIILGLVMLLYPINLYWNTKIKKHFSYL